MRFQSLERLIERSASNSAIVCPSTPAAPWLAFTFLKASQTSRFGMSNGFALATELLPLPVGSGSQLNNALGRLPLRIGATGSHVPYNSLIRLRAAYVPDVARAVFGTAPELIPGAGRPPGFDIAYGISTPHQRFACARLSGSHLTNSCPAFCCNAHHHRS